MLSSRVASIAALFALAGCVTVPENEGAPATVAQVVSRIKADLETYQQYNSGAAAAAPLDDTCHGLVVFTIDNVKVSLTTQTDDSLTGNGSAILPVGPGAFLPSLTGTRERKGTQTLTFSLYPQTLEAAARPSVAPKPIDGSQYPIAASLQQLREGLLTASQQTPCVSLVPPPSAEGKAGMDAGGSFAFGFTVINQASAGGTFKFAIFSLGATGTVQRQAANTITVTFKARPGSVGFIR